MRFKFRILRQRMEVARGSLEVVSLEGSEGETYACQLVFAMERALNSSDDFAAYRTHIEVDDE